MRKSGRVDLLVRSIEPLHHGQGSIGNTQILRTQRVYSPDTDRLIRLPYVSGNSLKHQIRVGMTRFALDVMNVRDRSMTKPMVHLLFSGGALGKKGSTIKLDKARELERLFPPLGVCGYSAGNVMPPSRIKVDHLHLVCLENKWRMPQEVTTKPEAQRRMAEFRSEELGTRHEPTRVDHYAKLMLNEDDVNNDIKSASKAADEMKAGIATKKQGGSAQMLYEFEVIASGALWWGGMYYESFTSMEMMALISGFRSTGYDSDGNRFLFMLGAKSSVGFGRSHVSISGIDNVESSDISPYVDHLKENSDEIIKMLTDLA